MILAHLLAIFTFVDLSTLKNCLFLSRTCFLEITKYEKIHKAVFNYFKRRNLQWTPDCFNVLCQFNSEFCLIYKRVYPFYSMNVFKFHSSDVKLIECNKLIVECKKFNKYELELFNEELGSDFDIIKLHSYKKICVNKYISSMDINYNFNHWKSIIQQNPRLVIAGGSVLQNLFFDKTTKHQDLDFFVLDYKTGDEDAFMLQLQNFTSSPIIVFQSGNYTMFHVKTYYVNFTKNLSLLSENSINKSILKNKLIKEGFWTRIQLIWHQAIRKKWHLLYLFDLDVCQIGFDGQKLFYTYSFLAAMQQQSIINYKINIFGIYILDRMYKYKERFGFALLLPKEFIKSRLNGYLAQKGESWLQLWKFNPNAAHQMLCLDPMHEDEKEYIRNLFDYHKFWMNKAVALINENQYQIWCGLWTNELLWLYFDVFGVRQNLEHLCSN